MMFLRLVLCQLQRYLFIFVFLSNTKYYDLISKVQYEVIKQKSLAGIVITSSHNPKEWNGLKFVGSDGLFLSPPKCKGKALC